METIRIRKRERPVIRVFVSSTFSDFRFERNALHRYVFTELERRCLGEGFHFQAIDLRWGVSTEAGLDHRTMKICFEEVRRSQYVSPQPNFLILLGNRYGWRPLPEEISEQEFDLLVAAAQSVHEQGSVSPSIHGKSPEQILRDWYRCDHNVLIRSPHENHSDRTTLNYILQSRRQDLGDGRDYTQTSAKPPTDTNDWCDVQEMLWAIINAAFPPTQLAKRFLDMDWQHHLSEVHDPQSPKRAVPQIVRFQGSATEQEIWAGAFSVPNAGEHVIALFREFDSCDIRYGRSRAKDFFDLTREGDIDSDASAAQQALKTALRERLGQDAIVNLPTSILTHAANGPAVADGTKHGMRAFCDKLVNDTLWPIIQQQMDDWKESAHRVASTSQSDSPLTASDTPVGKISPERELEIEREEHRRIAEHHTANFVGRNEPDGPLQKIAEYLQSDSKQPFVLYGDSGCGKTALMAKAFQVVPPNQSHIIRFLGVTPQSSDLRSLLTNLCLELRQDHPLDAPVPQEVAELQREFRQHLVAASDACRSIILFLDGLDQLEDCDSGLQLNWLPGGPTNLLPQQVKVVVSCLADRAEDDPAGQPFAILNHRGLINKDMYRLGPLLIEQAKRLFFDVWLRDAGRTLDGNRDYQTTQRNQIESRLTANENSLHPLFLKFLFEDVRLWRSYDDRNSDLPDTVDALLEQFFARLSLKVNHGPLLVRRVLAYLAAARRGLREAEILEVLFKDREFRRALLRKSLATGHRMHRRPKRIPIAIWARLRFDLNPFLTERLAPGASVLTWYHRQVADWVDAEVGRESDSSHGASDQRAFHLTLADYFGTGKFVSDSNDCKQSQRQTSTEISSLTRGMDEIAWQLTHAECWLKLECLLRHPGFIECKRNCGLSYDLLHDYERALASWGGNSNGQKNIADWSSFLHRFLGDLRNARQSVYQLAHNSADSGSVVESVERLLEEGKWPNEPWVRLLNRPSLLQSAACMTTAFYPRIDAASVDSTGRFMLMAGRDDSIRRADLHTGEVLDVVELEIKGHLVRLSMTPDGAKAIIVAAYFAWIWDFTDNHLERVVGTFDGRLSSVSIEDSGRFAIAGDLDGTLYWIDVSSRIIINKCSAHSDVTTLALSPDGASLITGGGDDCLVKLWSTGSLHCVSELSGHESPVFASCVTPDGNWAATGSKDGSVRVWDLREPKCQAELRIHNSTVNGLAITSDGQTVISGGFDKRICVWDVATKECTGESESHSRAITNLFLCDDQKRLISTSWDGAVKVWSTEDLRNVKASRDVYQVTSMAKLTDHFIAVGDTEGRVKLVDVSSRKSRLSINAHDGSVLALGVQPHTGHLVSLGKDKNISVWNPDTGTNITTFGKDLFEQADQCPVSLDCITDGAGVLCGSLEGVVIGWNVEAATPASVWRTPPLDLLGFTATFACRDAQDEDVFFSRRPSGANSVDCIAALPDGWRAATAGPDGRITLWNVFNGESLDTMRVANGRLFSLAVSPDGQWIAAANRNSVSIIRVDHNAEPEFLGIHDGICRCIVFRNDQRWIASCGDDGYLNLLSMNAQCAESGFSHTVSYRTNQGTPRAVVFADELVLGTTNGLEFLKLEGVPEAEPALLTPTVRWRANERGGFGSWDRRLTVRCPHCGTIMQVQEGNTEVRCGCGQPMRLNPFYCDNRTRILGQ
ncbi:DUF4062 domain-containing protein [Stieleria varia]|uniref:WD domain, G-beta repeat n=1 Tax=Stieleria varia TaxID=2528005 RepID=A0A5C6B5P7_9BACT|nr:DUF4062 domain-containing protein [Stieleria varia]TWU07433.1 WD domain, G-beta repeat [Stieleria varia]